jgi:hypothetical protein
VKTDRKKSYALIQMLLSVLCIFAVFILSSNHAQAVSNTSSLNFQARVLTAAGAVIPDGSYNIDFKLYNIAIPTAGTVGTCSGNCLWEETYAYGGYAGGSAVVGPQVTVKNGYISVNLGAYDAFASTINWSAPLYLSMNIGGTTSSGVITWDGEMGNGGPLSGGNSLLALTAVPVAFTANSLSTNNTGGIQSLVFAAGTSAGTITLPDVAGFAVIAQSGTPVSVAGNTAITGYSSANNFVGVAGADVLDTATAGVLNIGTTTATSIVLGQNTSLASTLRLSLGSGGTATSQFYVSGNIPTSAIGSASTGTHPESVFNLGNYSYIANTGTNTLQVIDVSSPASPVTVGTSATTGLNGPDGVYVQGRYAYIVNYTGNTIQTFDISNPANPVSIGTATTASNPIGIYVQGRYAYVTNAGSTTFQIFDISNPSTPVLYGSLTTSGSLHAVYVQGHYAYVTVNSGLLQVIDVSNPASPVGLGTVSIGTNSFSVYVQGRYAYVANTGTNTLQVIDVSNPSSLVTTGTSATTGLSSPQSVYVQGRYAYVANYGGATLQEFDISNPASPTSIGSVGTGTYPYSLFIQGRYAYVASYGYSEIQIFDLGGAYVQQLQAGGTETGTLTVDTNSQVNGSETVAGSLGVGTSLNVSGSAALGGLTITGLATPSAPTVTPTGTTGASSYTYAVVAFNSSGQSAASATTTTTTGNATISGTNYNAIAWTAVAGAAGYNIYRTATTGLTPGNTTGIVGTVYSPSLSFHDTGANAGNLAIAPTIATAGVATVVTNSTNAFQVTNIAGSSILNVNTSSASINLNQILPPGTITTTLAPTISTPTTAGTTGSTSYSYEVVAAGPNGSFTYPSPIATVTTGNATLSATNYNIITWGTVTGATNYYVYRTADGTTATAIGLIGVVASGTTTLHDTGLTTTGTAPALTGSLSNGSPYYFKITAIDGTGGQTIASPETSATATTATNLAIDLSWAPVTGARGYNIYYGNSSGGETNGYFTTYTNSFNFNSTSVTSSGFIPTISTAYNNTLSTTGNSQVTLGNTAGSASTAQLDVAGNVPSGAVGSIATGTHPNSVYVQGSYAYVLNRSSSTLQIFNISNPANPVSVGTVATAGFPQSIYVQGSYAYTVNEGSSTLQIFNISNPANPVVVSSISTGTTPYSIYVQGSYAYVVNEASSTLQIFNISNPANPVSVGTVATAAYPVSVYVQGNYAYEVNDTPGLQIFNISNPANPVNVGNASAGLNNPNSVYVQGSYAYVIDSGFSTLNIFNISNPASPVAVGNVATGSTPYSVYVQGSYAYVVNEGGSTLQMIDISNPANPVSVGTVSTGTNPYSVYVQGRYAYVVNYGSSTLQVFDLGGAYIQQLQVGGTETGTLVVDTNAYIGGNESISGSLGVNSSLNVAGTANLANLSVGGVTGPSTPSAPTVTPTGTTGSTSYSYAIVAIDASGQSAASLATQTTTGNATLSATNYNTISWSAVSNATSYNIYRTASSGTPSSTGLIGQVSSNTIVFNDTGLAGNSTSAPSVSSVGTIVLNTNTSSGSVNLDQLLPPGTITLVSPPIIGSVTPVGTIGSTSYTYEVAAVVANGATTYPSSTFTQFQGNATLSAVNYNTISWGAVTGATNYYVYRTASGGTPSSTGLIGVVPSGTTTFNDTGSTSTTITSGSETGGVLSLGYASTPYWATQVGLQVTLSGFTMSTGSVNGTGTILSANATSMSVGITGGITSTISTMGAISSPGLLLNATGTAPSLTGSLISNQTYYFKVTALDGTGGQTVSSGEVSQATGGCGGPTTTTSGSETGTTLTLNYASSGCWSSKAGYQVTLSGYTMSTGSVNGTWTILTATATSMTVAITGGVTSTISTQGTASLEFGGINLSWAPVTGARGYNVYYGTSSGGETNGYFTTYTNSFNFTTTTGATPGTIPTISTAYNNTLSTTGNSQITLGNTTGSASTAQLDVAGSVPISALSTISTGSNPHYVYVLGNYAYVVNSASNTMQIFDISNPSNPSILSTTSTDTDPVFIVVSGHYAYITNGSGNGGLDIFDVSNPASPVLTFGSNIDTTFYGWHFTGISIQGKYAYLITQNYLNIVDISSPYDPVFVGSAYLNIANGAWSVQVQGRYAYIMENGTSTISIVDISSPTNPVVVSITAVTGAANYLVVQGEYLYVANNSSSMQIYNISNPANPVLISNLALSGTPNALYVQGKYAYIANYSGSIQTVDVSSPANPVLVGSVSANTSTYDFVQGRYLYSVSNSTPGYLQIFDLGGAYVQQLQAGGAEVGSLSVDSNALIQGNTLISGSLNVGQGIQVTGDSAINGSLTITGTIPTYAVSASPITGGVGSVDVVGGYTYLTTGSTLEIFDTSIPTNPVKLSSLSIGGIWATSMTVQGQYVYIVNSNTGNLTIVNASNPSNPVIVSVLGGFTYANALAVSGNYVYIVQGTTPGWLDAVNVSNPSQPFFSQNIQMGINLGSPGSLAANFTGVSVQGNYAYVTAYGSGYGLYVINITNPQDMFQVGYSVTQNVPIGVYVQGNYAYISQTQSLQVFDITNPANPVNVGSNFANTPSVAGVSVQGRYVYLANSTGNDDMIQIFDISYPYGNFPEAGTISTNSPPNAIFTQGEYVYVGTNNGLQIFQVGGAYVQQLQAGGTETGTLTVDSTAQINGNEAVNGSLNVGTSLNVSGLIASGSLATSGLATPTIPTETVTCSGTCATAYAYSVTANNNSGSSSVSPSVSTGLTANASLNTTTEYNKTSWSAVSGASSYNVYRVAGGSAQGLIGTVNYTSALTPTSGSETGATLTLNFSTSTPPPWVVGQGITLSGFTMNTGSVNGTWPILSVTSTSITINILGGVTSTISTEGTATGALAFYDTAQSAGYLPPNVATSGAVILTASSGAALQVQSASGTPVFTIGTASPSINLQQTATSNLSSVTNVDTVTLNSAVQVGDTLVLESGAYSSTNIVSISGGGVIWKQASYYNDCILGRPCTAGDLETWYGLGSSGAVAGSTLTITYSGVVGAGYGGVNVSEWSGVSSLDFAETGYTTGATSPKNTPSFAPASSGELIIAGINFNNITTPVASPYTAMSIPPSSGYNAEAYYIDPNTSATNATWPAGSVAGDIVDTVAFKPIPPNSTTGNFTANGSLIVNGSTAVDSVVNSTNAFQVSNASGSSILNTNTTSGIVNIDALSAPGSITATLPPTISATTTAGTAGSTTYTYEVVAAGPNGSTTYPSPTNSVTTGNATLSATNYNIITWGTVTGATNYYVYRTASGGTPSSTGLIAVVPSGTTTLNDKALAATGTSPTLTGSLINGTTYYFEVTAIDGTGGQTLPSSEIYATATTSTNLAINLSWAPVTGARGYDVYYGNYGGTPGGEINGYFTTYTNSYNFTTTSGTTAGKLPTVATAYNNTLSSTGNSQLTLGSTTGSASTAQLDVAGNVPTSAISTLSLGGAATGIYVQGSYAYVPNYASNSFQIINISNPANTVIVGSVYAFEAAFVAVQGSYAYVPNTYHNTLQIINISNPANPVTVGSIATGVFADYVYVQGSYAYVINNTSMTLQIINISNPANPVTSGTVSIGTDPRFVYVQGNYAYVINYGSSSLQIINISNPANPVTASIVATGTNPTSVYVQGNYAYVADYGTGNLQIFDISNFSNPVAVGTVATGSNPYSVYVQGNYAYVTNIYGVPNANTLQIINISNPATPVIIGTVATGNLPQYLFVQGRYAYVVNNTSSTFQIFDLGGAYIQQLQAGGTETGTLIVDTNSQINGSESIAGSLGIGTSLQVSGTAGLGSLTVSGLATPAAPTVTVTGTASTSYAYAIAANNISGTSPLSTATLITNGAATLNSSTSYIETSWSAIAGISSYSVYRTVGGAAHGLIGIVGNTSSLIPTSATQTGTVVTLNFSSAPQWTVGQAITLSGFTSTGTINGTWPILTVTATSITLNITSGVTSTISVMGLATGILGFFDTATTATGGVPTSGSAGTIGFASATGNTITLGTSNTTSAYSLILPTTAPSVNQCLESGGTTANQLVFNSCTSAHPQTIVLTPEYAGAVLSNGVWTGGTIGTMTAGFDATQTENYYQWTTSQSTNQSYVIAISVPLPDDFGGWYGTTPISVDVKTSNTTNGTVTAKLYDSAKSLQSANWNTCSLTPGTTSWTTVTGCALSGGTWTASTNTSTSYITLLLQLQAPTGGTTEVGNISLNYTSSY